MKKTFTTATLWVVIFVASYAALSAVGLVPIEFTEINARITEAFAYQVDTTSKQDSSTQDTKTEVSAEHYLEKVLPERIVIEKINVNTPVMNPESRDIAVLDQALLNGVVRYPGSGGLDDNSNMFLFGHSTSFRQVHNVAFQAFNRLGELQIGDTIKTYSGGTEYRYKVISVSQVNKDKALVEFSSGEKLLTLTTCDTFGERSDRFVVVARFVQAIPFTR